MLKSSETTQALAKWLELVPDAHHWCKIYGRLGHRFCILGGMFSLDIGCKQEIVVHDALAETIKRLYPARVDERYLHSPPSIVAIFNDHPKTTYKDVRRVVVETMELST